MSENNGRRAGKSSPVLQVILSVLCAIGLWMYVMSVESPMYSETFYGISVELRNASVLSQNGLSVLTGHGNVVDVTVTGRRSTINQLKNDDFTAYADLANISAVGEYPLEIKVETADGVSVSGLSESSVLVYADVTTTKTITISTDIQYNGGVNAEVGYSLGKPYIVPTATMPDVTATTISGPVSVLGLVDHARVKSIDIGAVNIGANTGSITYNDAVLQLVDANGAIVDNPHIKSVSTNITVNFPVIMEKSVPVKADFVTEPAAADFKISVSPSRVSVKGEKSLITALEQITFTVPEKAEDIVGANEYDLPALDGVEITDGTVKVTLEVEKVEAEPALASEEKTEKK